MCYKHKHKDHHSDWDWHDKHEKDSCMGHTKKQDICVKEILEAILEAQRKAEKVDDCKISCKESIKELLGECKKPKKNTIPFILYCGDCEPFKATGVTTFTSPSKCKKFACITSFIFRIKDIDHKCAVLELLAFKPEKKKENHCEELCSPCCQIDCENVDDLMRTGICITVDLSCFCAITCLPAVCLKNKHC